MRGFRGFTAFPGFGPARRAGGGGEPVITIAAPTFSESFDSYADGTRLVAGDPNVNTGFINANPGDAGWTAIKRVADGGGNARFNQIVWQGRVVRRTTNSSDASNYLITPNVSITGLPTVSAGLKAINSTTWTSMTFRAASEENLFRVTLQGPNTNLKLDRVAATTATNLASLIAGSSVRRLGGGGGFQNFNQTNDRVTCIMYNDGTNNKAILRRANGHTLGTATGYTFTDIAGGLFGFIARGTPNTDGVDFIEAQPTGTVLTVTETHDLWRSGTLGLGGYVRAATYTFSGLYFNGAPTRLQWALFDPETDEIVKEWALVPSGDATIGSGAWSVNVIVPWGLNGRKAYCIGFRPVNASNVADPLATVISNREFAVTYNVACAGQSNSVFLTNGMSTGPATSNQPGSYVYAPTTGTAKRTSKDYYETTAATTTQTGGTDAFGNILSEYLNGPVSMSTVGIGARQARDLGPDNPDGISWALVQEYFAASGPFEAIYLSQGENDSTDALAPLWVSQWKDVNFPAYLALSGQPEGTTIPIFVQYTGRIGSTLEGAQLLHEAQDELVATMPNCYLAASYVGIKVPADDHLHYTNEASDQGYWGVGRRLGLTMRHVLSGTGYDGVGPRAQTPTRSGAVVTVPYDLRGATGMVARNGEDGSLTADPGVLVGAWQVSADDFATTLTISSTVLTGTNVVITLSADPAAPVKVRNHAGDIDIDISSWPFGEYADGTFNPSKPIFTALETAT